jgi:transposase
MRHKKKAAIIRQLRRVPAQAVLQAVDETLLRWFPPLRNCWSLRGQQANVPITGRNDKCVLTAALNLQTGHRVLQVAPNQQQGNFQAFLRELRRRYRHRPIYLLLDGLSSHTTPQTQALAAQLKIQLIWLPKQHPELNPVDQLFRELKSRVAANRQFRTMAEEALAAQVWFAWLTNLDTLRKAGLLSKKCWLKTVCQNFCVPT